MPETSEVPIRRRFAWSPASLLTQPPSSSHIEQWRKHILCGMLQHPLDRVNVLGDVEGHGHTGCVNALSWADDGNVLLSGGDDTTVRIWRLDASDTEREYPFTCRSVIQSGHRANIFSAQMLPHSSRIATAAGDSHVRVFDLRATITPDTVETEYTTRQSCTRVIRCHEDRVKRIVTEDSPDLFLSVSEDGTVRQHDLRTSHNCRAVSCPAALVKLGISLNTLSISSLTPYQFVVAGESPYGYLYDRRHLRRVIESEWGAIPRAGQEATTCVRRFGRQQTRRNGEPMRSEHITGARMSASNGHEVLLSYSGDGIYLFSTKDDPQMRDGLASSTLSPILPINVNFFEPSPHVGDSDSEDESAEAVFFDGVTSHIPEHDPKVPVIIPRRRFAGARNVATIKDVNFLGPNDEWIVSGSDDGNVFIWVKRSSVIHGIYEGDSSVVNMVEGHPHFPLVAVSGIDTTIKLFAPTQIQSSFSRTDDAGRIMETNRRLNNTRTAGYNITALVAEVRRAEAAGVPGCTGQ